MKKIRILLADDHVVVREGLKTALERNAADIEVVAEAGNGNEVLEFAETVEIDAFLLDLSMPNMNGFETTQQLRGIRPDLPVCALSMYSHDTFVEKALDSGVKGYVLKEDPTEEVIRALREVKEKRYYLSPKVCSIVIERFLDLRKLSAAEREPPVLTGRQSEILKLIGEGFNQQQIAKELGISPNTVHVHRMRIMKDLDLHSQPELVRYAIREGISGL